MKAGFESFPIENGTLFELSGSGVWARGWRSGELELPEDGTHFGVLAAGRGTLELPAAGPFPLSAGMYFAAPGRCLLSGADGCALVISVAGYRGLTQVGGPVERRGRLRYLDGCSDTLLVSPPRRGEPCLNHLHVPPGTRQTAHSHPSARIGVILAGGGVCAAGDGSHALIPGLAWHIPPGSIHSFRTEESSLDVAAWHPDSDFGPTDEDHPMRNRTVVAATPPASP